MLTMNTSRGHNALSKNLLRGLSEKLQRVTLYTSIMGQAGLPLCNTETVFRVLHHLQPRIAHHTVVHIYTYKAPTLGKGTIILSTIPPISGIKDYR